MKYILFSKTDILVEVAAVQETAYALGGEVRPTLKSEVVKLNLKLPLEVQKGQIVKVFSLDKAFIPFCFEVGAEHKNIKTITLENSCLLEVSPEPIVSGDFFLTRPFQGGVASVVGAPFRFNVITETEKYSYFLSEKIYNFEIHDKKHIVFLFATSADGDLCVAFHKNQKKFLEFYGDVEITGEHIKAIKKLQTLARHGELVEVAITEHGFEMQSSEAVYVGGKPAFVPPFLTHIAFFEAVKVKDYFLAKSYLTDEFARSLQPEHFEDFFGEFEEILPLKEKSQTKVALLEKKGENAFVGKTYLLEFREGKICNIVSDI